MDILLDHVVHAVHGGVGKRFMNSSPKVSRFGLARSLHLLESSVRVVSWTSCFDNSTLKALFIETLMN